MKTLALLSCLLAFSVYARATEEKVSWSNVLVERKSPTAPVVSVYYQGGLMAEDDIQPVACVWADGRAVWSENRHQHSGPPYFTGQVDPKRLEAFLTALRASGIYAHKQWGLIMTDGPSINATIFDGAHRVELGTAPGAYAVTGNLPKHIIKEQDAAPYLRHQVELLLPRPGQKLRFFRWELRRID